MWPALFPALAVPVAASLEPEAVLSEVERATPSFAVDFGGMDDFDNAVEDLDGVDGSGAARDGLADDWRDVGEIISPDAEGGAAVVVMAMMHCCWFNCISEEALS